MPQPAAPRYLADAARDEATPSMRFGMLLPIWTGRQEQEAEIHNRSRKGSPEGIKLKEILRDGGMDAAIAYASGLRAHALPTAWKKNDADARLARREVAILTAGDTERMAALAARQRALRASLSEDRHLAVEAIATAPFVTGLGNAHPLENGFAFLEPHGLPYLPGSGVKGAVRRAAEELAGVPSVGVAWDIPSDWTAAAVEVLFGPAEGDLRRGALSFWDVVPQIDGDRLAVEIMTPHQSHYYQKAEPPHDSGSPVPVPFLAVPPGAGFPFTVVCDLDRLVRADASLVAEGRWKSLLLQAFEHAFDWCGFGAKTAVGYGAMVRDVGMETRLCDEARAAREAAEAAQAAQERLAGLSPLEREIDDLASQGDPNKAGYLKIIEQIEAGHWSSDEDRRAAAGWVKRQMVEAGDWAEQTKSKKPQNDKRYQRTLKVKGMLGE